MQLNENKIYWFSDTNYNSNENSWDNIIGNNGNERTGV